MTSKLSQSKPRKHVQIAVAIYGVATVLLFYVAASPLLNGRSEAKASTRGSQPAEEIQVEVARRSRVARQAAPTQTLVAQPEADSPTPSNTEPPPQTPTTPEEEAEKLDRKLEADGPPDAVMVNAQNAFASVFTKGAIPGASLDSIECRASVCRAKVGFGTTDDDRAFFRHIIADPDTRLDFGLSVMIPIRKRDADGHTQATVYMYRPVAPPADTSEYALTVERVE